ncbi:MAG: hypothetical protein ACI9FR_001399 [Cryomorphaceae bacterium]|jgi:hypothetical protein
MNILQEILTAQDGGVVGQLAQQFGINAGDASKALANLIPAIAGGIKKNAQSPSSLESLISKLDSNKNVSQSIDQPSILGRADISQTGNEILGDIFGSKDVSRTVAGQTAQSTGIDPGILKKMLPIVASLVMSSLNKKGQASGGGLGDLLGGLAGASQAQPQKRGGLGGLLGSLFGGNRAQAQTSPSGGLESLLDFDGDGNIADDVLDLAKKLF